MLRAKECSGSANQTQILGSWLRVSWVELIAPEPKRVYSTLLLNSETPFVGCAITECGHAKDEVEKYGQPLSVRARSRTMNGRERKMEKLKCACRFFFISWLTASIAFGQANKLCWIVQKICTQFEWIVAHRRDAQYIFFFSMRCRRQCDSALLIMRLHLLPFRARAPHSAYKTN